VGQQGGWGGVGFWIGRRRLHEGGGGDEVSIRKRLGVKREMARGVRQLNCFKKKEVRGLDAFRSSPEGKKGSGGFGFGFLERGGGVDCSKLVSSSPWGNCPLFYRSPVPFAISRD